MATRGDSREGDARNHESDDTRYLRRVSVENTKTPNPLQDPVRSPDVLFHFMHDVQDSSIPKMWGIFLDENYGSVGNEPLALGESALPQHFNAAALFRFYYVLGASRFILLTNHTSADAAPTTHDRALISDLQVQSKLLDGVEFFDYVVVTRKSYWSMTVQDGTACHCGQQHYVPEG